MTDQIDTNRRNLLTSGIAGAAAAGASLAAATGAFAQTTPSGMLEGKVALVTGAARGIGRSITEEYARHGAAVVMLDVADPSAVPPVEGFRIANSEEFDAAFEAVRAINPNTLQIRGDVRSEDDLDGAVSQAISRFGGLDIAVANAGYVRWHGFADGRELDWKSVLDVNVWGVANTFRAATPALRQRGGGRLISISSIGGRQGVPGNGAYTSSKWAVIGLTKQAAIELGPDNITVNAIAPGPVDTPMYRSEAQIASMGLSTAAEQDAALNPMLPVGDRPALAPVDIANTAVFLAGDAGASISGVSLDVALGYNAFYTS
ncbi:SDR family oxidoreductase [Cognatiyoonia sp. IB215182]|uniref:SDR family oxidoreductase n=1 Tax=Cognatiyoonia sp. IB215182 TaxID=3097353 RepID=UPI002A14B11D|nr:SDR family oxidoreductase [Cognatiyoonia sp. IB215182]MDX8350995.1 SDR family oxidoreductase [Cognatiyoonia sp. IB215182]